MHHPSKIMAHYPPSDPFYDLKKIYLHFIYLSEYSPELGLPLIAERLSSNLKIVVSSVSHRFTQVSH